MSASKIVRNAGGYKVVTYGGADWVFPGNGDTTMVPGHVADHVEQFYSREGLLIVHPDTRTPEEIEAQQAADARREAELAEEAADTSEFGPPCVECGARTKNESGFCDSCEAEEKGDAPEPVVVPLVAPVPDPPAPPKPAKPSRKAAAKKKKG